MPKTADSNGFETLMRRSYQLINNIRKPLEQYRNAFSILNEYAEKNYKIYSSSVLSANPAKIAISLKALIYSDKLKSFFEKYSSMVCVQSNKKSKDNIIMAKGIASLRPHSGVQRLNNTTSNRFWKKNSADNTVKKPKSRCHSEEPRFDDM